MKYILKFILISSLFVTSLVAEDSVFLSNSVESMTSLEKATYNNSKQLQKQKSSIGSLKYKTNTLDDKLESLSASINLFTNSISDVKTSLNSNKKDETLPIRIGAIENKFNDLNKTNQKLNKLIVEITSIIDSINSSYVSKEQFEIAYKKLEERMFKLENQDIKYSFKSNNAELMKEALSLYKQKKYTLAKMQFKELVSRHYKPAKSNYYIGEINYYQKLYSEAIISFKTSFKLYSKSSYIPTLLLHTGKSLLKLSQKQEAKKFFSILTANYATTKEAKEAKKYLK